MALLLKHQTAAELVARFREAFRNSERDRVVTLASNLLARIAAGDITDAQVRNAFNLTTPQYNTLKTKMENWIAARNTILSAVGE